LKRVGGVPFQAGGTSKRRSWLAARNKKGERFSVRLSCSRFEFA
jgi:hypothetical protein